MRLCIDNDILPEYIIFELAEMQEKGETMNSRLLKAKMFEAGITEQEMAGHLGVDASTFYRKKTGNSDFTREEIKKMKNILSLTPEDVDRIFFAE